MEAAPRRRLGPDRRLHGDPVPEDGRKAADPARPPAPAVHAVRYDVPSDRLDVPDAPARRALRRDLPDHGHPGTRLVRLDLSADRLHGVRLPTDRAADRGEPRAADEARPRGARRAPHDQKRRVRVRLDLPRAHFPRVLRRRERAFPVGDRAAFAALGGVRGLGRGRRVDVPRLRRAARAGVPRGLPLRPLPVGAARPPLAHRRLRRAPGRAAGPDQGAPACGGEPRRLHRLRRLCDHLSDRDRHPRRIADGVHPLYAVHRRLRRRHGKNGKAQGAHPLRRARRVRGGSRTASCGRGS